MSGIAAPAGAVGDTHRTDPCQARTGAEAADRRRPGCGGSRPTVRAAHSPGRATRARYACRPVQFTEFFPLHDKTLMARPTLKFSY